MPKEIRVEDIPRPSRGTFETRSFPVRKDLTGLLAQDPQKGAGSPSRFVPRTDYEAARSIYDGLPPETRQDLMAYAKLYCADIQKPERLKEAHANLQQNHAMALEGIPWRTDQFLQVIEDSVGHNGKRGDQAVVSVEGRPILANSKPSVFAFHLGENITYASSAFNAKAQGDDESLALTMSVAGFPKAQCEPAARRVLGLEL